MFMYCLCGVIAVVLMEGGDEEDLERLDKIIEKEAKEDDEDKPSAGGTLAGLIDTKPATASSSKPSAATGGTTLSKKVTLIITRHCRLNVD